MLLERSGRMLTATPRTSYRSIAPRASCPVYGAAFGVPFAKSDGSVTLVIGTKQFGLPPHTHDGAMRYPRNSPVARKKLLNLGAEVVRRVHHA